jgi:hypothetical protein
MAFLFCLKSVKLIKQKYLKLKGIMVASLKRNTKVILTLLFNWKTIKGNYVIVRKSKLLDNKKLSSITFSLYLYHMPMLILIAAVMPFDKGSYVHVLSILRGVIIMSGILSVLTEKRHHLLKHFIKKLLQVSPNWQKTNI